jgi:hypothetical protein
VLDVMRPLACMGSVMQDCGVLKGELPEEGNLECSLSYYLAIRKDKTIAHHKSVL